MVTTATERLERVLQEYDAQGWHRTGTAVDAASADWLAGLVRAQGLEPVLEEFELQRVDPVAAFVEAGGRRVEGLPLFDCAYSATDGVTGRLGQAGSEATIGLTSSEVNGLGHRGLHELRRSSRHAAIVAATRGGHPGIAAINATEFLQPFGPPVLLVAGEELPWLEECERRGETLRLVACCRRTPAKAINVAVTIPGTRPELAPLGVVTPRSGWWACASERGGGIACWLAILEALRQAAPARTVQMVATSGHELDFLGFVRYLERHAGAATAALAWIHLGANIGTRDPDQGNLRHSSAAIQQLSVEALTRHLAGPFALTPPGPVQSGEAREISAAGGHFVSLVGGNSHFHQQSDRYPQAVNLDSVRRYAEGFADLAVRLATDPELSLD